MAMDALPQYAFDRPVIIVAAPRSGSTLLFETLSRAESLWTIGDESHAAIEHIDKLNPATRQCASNRLESGDADPATVQHLRQVFYERLRDREGRAAAGGPVPPRFLEKTPKNALRIPFLNEVFPDALYIYLYRDPRENLSSMMEAWRSSHFVTYANLPDWPGRWSLLLPPGYGSLRGSSLEDIVAFQWRSANETILDDLATFPGDRWTAVSYAELVADPTATISRLCGFADIPFDERLRAYCGAGLALSRYTKSTPETGKWRANEAGINRVIPRLAPLIERMDEAVAPYTSSAVLTSGPIVEAGTATEEPPHPVQGRNERCACGSGLRYKHCHGRIEMDPRAITNTQQ
jgi:hypothetical protein